MYFREFNLYSAGDFDYHECRIPALLKSSKQTILAFTEARKFTGRDTDQVGLFVSRSVDGGNSFEDVQVLATREGWACHNPAPVQDRETGTIWLFFCKNPKQGNEAVVPAGQDARSVWPTKSTYDGKTWSDHTIKV